jgi:hypothetical protein
MNITYTKLSDSHYMLFFLSILLEWSTVNEKSEKFPHYYLNEIQEVDIKL